jgi:hypothetical protein
MNSSATPSCPSLTPACACTAGSAAPQLPQNVPNAAKPPSTRSRPAAAIPAVAIPALCQRATAAAASLRGHREP